MADVAGERLPLPHGQHAIVTEYGADQLDAIERCLEIVPQPPPLLSELKDEDVVIAVEASEVFWTDTVMMTGQYQHQPRLPFTPGTVSGRVIWLGTVASAKGVQMGMRVIAQDIGARSSGHYQKWGGCASYAVCPATSLQEVPPHWTFEQAACFGYGYGTVHYCLVEVATLQPGQTILVQGATGGVGIPAVQMAKLLGAVVIAATRSADKVDFLKSLGADHVIRVADDVGTPCRFSGDVKKLTGGKGVDVVYDGVGGDAISVESMRACKFGAMYLIVGWAATPNVAAGGGAGRGQGAPNPNRIPTNLIMMKGLHVIGCPAVISLTAQGPEKGAAIMKRRLQDINEWVFSGRLPPPTVGKVFPLSDVKSALRTRVDSGSVLGSTVVCPPRLPNVPVAKL